MAAGGVLTVGAGGLALWVLVGAQAATSERSAAAGYGVSATGRNPATTSPSTAPTTAAPTAAPTAGIASGAASSSGSNSKKAATGRHDSAGKVALAPVGTWARGLLHGTVVVSTGNGTQTLVVQRGRVTAVTATTVTVASSDGYRLVWTVPATWRRSAEQFRVPGSARTFPVGSTVEAIGRASGRGTAEALAIRAWPHSKPIRPTLPPQPIDPIRPIAPTGRPGLPTYTGGPITAGPKPVDPTVIDPPYTIDPPITIAAW